MKIVMLIIMSLLCQLGTSQFDVEGYVFQENNRGFLNRVEIIVSDNSGNEIDKLVSDRDGFFSTSLPTSGTYQLIARKEMFEETSMSFNTIGKSSGEKVYLKVEMKRAPGYTFEVTMADARDNEEIPVDAIKGALIEVYNNTKEKEDLVLKDHPFPDFQVNMLKGNHYTILIRKDGYLAKRMEAYVDVEGCILCFEGVGEIQPGVTDNLTEGNEQGVLLANLEMEKIEPGKTFEINNLYYEYAKWDLTAQARDVLQNVIYIFKDNPNLLIELGSHTDARGSSEDNMILSNKRAQSAVAYLKTFGNIPATNIIAKGYGESEIVNRCKNGVDCSEKEHARNRRTELKILGTLSDYKFKSLVELKEDERTEALIMELQNQGQVKVKEGETLEDKLTEDNISPATKQKLEAPKKVEHNQASKSKQEVEDVTPRKKVELIDDFPVESTSEVPQLHYRIILHYGSIPLGGEHRVYKDFEDVEKYTSPQKYIYYSTGKFPSKEAAEAYLMKNIQSDYPAAYVARYMGDEKVK